MTVLKIKSLEGKTSTMPEDQPSSPLKALIWRHTLAILAVYIPEKDPRGPKMECRAPYWFPQLLPTLPIDPQLPSV